MALKLCMALAAFILVASATPATIDPESLAQDDACVAAGNACGLSALQRASSPVGQLTPEETTALLEFAAVEKTLESMARGRSEQDQLELRNLMRALKATMPQAMKDQLAKSEPAESAPAESEPDAAMEALDKLIDPAAQQLILEDTMAAAKEAQANGEAWPDFGHLTDALKKVTEAVTEGFSDVADNLKSNLPNISDAVEQAFAASSVAVHDALAKAADAAWTTYLLPPYNTSDLETISEALMATLEEAKGFAVLDSNAVKEAIGKVKGALSGMMNHTGDLHNLKNMQASAEAAAEVVANAVNSSFADLPHSAQKAVAEVVVNVALGPKAANVTALLLKGIHMRRIHRQ